MSRVVWLTPGFRHIASALNRLAPGGRLVAITGANVGPDMPDWRDAFVGLQERGRVVFTAAIAGAVYAKHGTTFPTRLTVIDKLPADDRDTVPGLAGHGARCRYAARLDRRACAAPFAGHAAHDVRADLCRHRRPCAAISRARQATRRGCASRR